jgi:hypothetical protein
MFAGLYSKILVWGMPAGGILAKSYPAAYKNQCIILYIIITAKMSAISLWTTE